MKLLITGALNLNESQLKDIEDLGYKIIFQQNESDPLVCDYEIIDAVICNALFLHHPIEKFTNLKLIQLTSAGLDRIPVNYIKEHNIKLFNARGVYSIPMAEFAISGVLDLYKQKRFFYENQKKHVWEKKRDLLELNGKTVTIVGCGSVGIECAKRFKAFGCHIIGVDLRRPNELFDEYFHIDDLNESLTISDVVILTLPLSIETNGMFDNDKFVLMKKNSVFVNISRGKIVQEKSLIKALKQNLLLGAVLDVFEDEPLSKDSPFWNMQNIILTPHVSFISNNSSDRMFEIIRNNLSNYAYK